MMTKSKTLIAALLLSATALIGFETGCAFHKVSTINPTTGATNITYQVDEANLAIDASVLQGVTSVAVAKFRSNPQVVQALTDAHIALDGIANGANTNTTQEVIKMLKAQNNPALTKQVESLVAAVSATEQKLIVRYGATVAGEISERLAAAVDAGIVVGLGIGVDSPK